MYNGKSWCRRLEIQRLWFRWLVSLGDLAASAGPSSPQRGTAPETEPGFGNLRLSTRDTRSSSYNWPLSKYWPFCRRLWRTATEERERERERERELCVCVWKRERENYDDNYIASSPYHHHSFHLHVTESQLVGFVCKKVWRFKGEPINTDRGGWTHNWGVNQRSKYVT